MIDKPGLRLVTLMLFLSIQQLNIYGQDNTVGTVYNSGQSYDAYTLFSPGSNNSVYLIDNDGRIVNQWDTESPPGLAVYLDDDGNLYRAEKVTNRDVIAGGAGGKITKYDWLGNLEWSYTVSDSINRSHHDFQVLPNGNLLLLVWEVHEEDEVIANGRDPDILSEKKLWSEVILEIEPTGSNDGNIVWEWRSWDHLVQDFDETKLNYGSVAANSGKIDLNYIEANKDRADWLHANSINYNAELDQILLSVLNFDEIWIIDHKTTTEEAKGYKGDLMYRWGNPRTYRAGTVDDQLLFAQHDAKWIAPGLPDEGKIMIFNNGLDRPGEEYSSVMKIEPTITENGLYQMSEANNYLPKIPSYEYTDEVPTNFYSWYISGAQQLPNGHILICSGAFGIFFEIDEAEEEVWRYINPVSITGVLTQGNSTLDNRGDPLNPVFRAHKYSKDYPAFEGKDLTPGSFIELEFVLSTADSRIGSEVYPNPTIDILNIQTLDHGDKIQLVHSSGRILHDKTYNERNAKIVVSHLPRGLYQVLIDNVPVAKVLLTY